LGAVENEKVGVYRIRTGAVKDNATKKVILLTLFALNKKAYYEVPELSRSPLFFLFECDITLERLHHAPEFEIGSFGGKMVVSVVREYGALGK
jgi:hypothetical protein